MVAAAGVLAAVQIHRGHHAAHARLEKLEFDGADADNAPNGLLHFAAVYHQVGAEAAHFHRLFKLAVEQGKRGVAGEQIRRAIGK